MGPYLGDDKIFNPFPGSLKNFKILIALSSRFRPPTLLRRPPPRRGLSLPVAETTSTTAEVLNIDLLI